MVSLIVLRAADLDASLAFYQALGLTFQEEQHGRGPLHYSTQCGSLVLEIYPGKPGAAPPRLAAGATMLGFAVSDLGEALARVSGLGAKIITPLQETEWGLRAVAADPDGRAVELSQS